MCMVSAVQYSSVKYHSVMTYFLTTRAKRARDIAWRAVLVGRYPLVLKTASPQPLSEREGLGTLPFGEGREGHSLSTKSMAPPEVLSPQNK